MSKRRVPAPLHRELTEYAALLRALRVRDAMDLTKHLTKASPFALGDTNNDDEQLNSNDDEAVSHWNASNPPTSLTSGSKSGVSFEGTDAALKTNMSAKAKGKRKAGSSTPAKPKQKQRRRDHWTRWPLLLEDVLIPEWTLEDEVAVIASQVLKSRPPPVFPVPAASPDDMEEDEEFVRVMGMEEMEEDDPDIPFYVPYLTSVMAEFLATILGLLASFTPARPASMQNRIEPLGWRTVIDMVVVSKFANAKCVALISS